MVLVITQGHRRQPYAFGVTGRFGAFGRTQTETSVRHVDRAEYTSCRSTGAPLRSAPFRPRPLIETPAARPFEWVVETWTKGSGRFAAEPVNGTMRLNGSRVCQG